MSGPGVAAVLEMLFLRSKSRLNSLRHCVDLLRQLDVVARQELVRDRVVDGEDVACAATCSRRCRARARRGCPARTSVRAPGRAGWRLRGVRLGRCRSGRRTPCCASLPAQRVAALDLEVGGARGAAERALVGAALRRARGDVVGALLQARHLHVDQEALRAVRGDAHRRPADQRPAGAAAHHAHADVGAWRRGRRSLVTTPVRLPALAPAGSELIDVTPTPAACAAGARREHRQRDQTTRRRRVLKRPSMS